MFDRTLPPDDSSYVAPRGGAMTAYLRVFNDPLGVVHPIEKRGTRIGRVTGGGEAEIQFDDRRVSKMHAGVGFDGVRWRIRDLDARNGTYVDGSPLLPGESRALEDRAVIRAGNTLAVFVCGDPGGPSDDDSDFFPGVSAAAHAIRQRVRVLVAGSGHVLIVGPTGSGKERIARRFAGNGSPVAVNCAALSPQLARSELFGYVKHAFSNAVEHHPGLVETAHGGVLFLDEVGELPLEVQAELLRFLEDGSYLPIGASKTRHSNVRVVAATNRDLDAEAARGRFRADLLGRLRASQPPIALTALTARREDIPYWADRFLRDLVADAPAAPWSAGALECLLLYPWPLNLRELRGAIGGAVEEPRSWPVASKRLPPAVVDHRRNLRLPGQAPVLAAPPPTAQTTAPPPGRSGPAAREASPSTGPAPALAAARVAPVAPVATREQLVAMLAETHGNVNLASRLLRLNRRSTYRLCVKYDIDIDAFRAGD